MEGKGYEKHAYAHSLRKCHMLVIIDSLLVAVSIICNISRECSYCEIKTKFYLVFKNCNTQAILSLIKRIRIEIYRVCDDKI